MAARTAERESFHHQAIDRLAKSLAHAPRRDGVIEALESRDGGCCWVAVACREPDGGPADADRCSAFIDAARAERAKGRSAASPG